MLSKSAMPKPCRAFIKNKICDNSDEEISRLLRRELYFESKIQSLSRNDVDDDDDDDDDDDAEGLLLTELVVDVVVVVIVVIDELPAGPKAFDNVLPRASLDGVITARADSINP